VVALCVGVVSAVHLMVAGASATPSRLVLAVKGIRVLTNVDYQAWLEINEEYLVVAAPAAVDVVGAASRGSRVRTGHRSKVVHRPARWVVDLWGQSRSRRRGPSPNVLVKSVADGRSLCVAGVVDDARALDRAPSTCPDIREEV
jgi:hypothetical protein